MFKSIRAFILKSKKCAPRGEKMKTTNHHHQKDIHQKATSSDWGTLRPRVVLLFLLALFSKKMCNVLIKLPHHYILSISMSKFSNYRMNGWFNNTLKNKVAYATVRKIPIYSIQQNVDDNFSMRAIIWRWQQ